MHVAGRHADPAAGGVAVAARSVASCSGDGVCQSLQSGLEPDRLPADDRAGFAPGSSAGYSIGAPLFLQNSLLADGRDGARVLQLFHLDDGSAILVDLGWLAEGARAAPRVRQLDAVGRWLPTPHRFTLSGAVVAAEGRVDALDMAALQRRVHGPLRAGVVVLEAAVAPLLPWPLAPEVDPLRNFGYSLQWLVMSAGLFFLALWPVRKRRQR